MDKRLMDAKELLLKEIDTIEKKGSISPTELDNLKKAIESVHYIYEVCKIDMEMGEEGEEGYSERGYSMRWNNSMPYDDRYYNIHSYRGGNNGSGGNSYKRDSMGRYSRTDAKSHMVDTLYSMMGDTDSEAERGAIQDCINRLKT